MKLKGKVSGWFYAVILGVAALLIPMIVMSWIDANGIALLINLLGFIAVELFCIPIVFYNYVELQEEALLIVFGFIKKRIPYSDIVALSTTDNPSSSLAASFDRIEIKCKSRTDTMISVMDKERFFHEMKKYHPTITIL